MSCKNWVTIFLLDSLLSVSLPQLCAVPLTLTWLSPTDAVHVPHLCIRLYEFMGVDAYGSERLKKTRAERQPSQTMMLLQALQIRFQSE